MLSLTRCPVEMRHLVKDNIVGVDLVVHPLNGIPLVDGERRRIVDQLGLVRSHFDNVGLGSSRVGQERHSYPPNHKAEQDELQTLHQVKN